VTGVIVCATAVAHAEAPQQVVIRGVSAEDRVRRSAAAVTVVELDDAKRESADMGEVLSRVEGVSVQREGGLGSAARFSLAGFDDTQVRFFIDGIPLEYQGFSLGLQNVPLASAERVEVYKGVVPVRLGADSLGGAFDLVTDRRTRGSRVAASYQGGSFDTHRFTGSARHLDERTGVFVKAEGFFDTTDNSYPINVRVGDRTGQIQDATVRRFHDDYRARGGNLEAGLVGRRWAQRLLLRAFANAYDKEIQHNARMTVPYGEAEFGGFSSGVSLRYEHDFGQGLSGSFVSGYVYDRTDFVDDPRCVYDWFGQCIVEREGRGEIRRNAADQSIWDHAGYLRWNLNWVVHPNHQINFSTSPTLFTRTGKDRLIDGDEDSQPLAAQRDLFKWISGAEHVATLVDRKLENIFFVKFYLHTAQTEEPVSADAFVSRNVQRLYRGIGNGLRYELTDWAIAKASYEYSVRLPDPGEVFGDGAQVIDNLELAPERSHNLNVSLLANDLETWLGSFSASTTGFFRDAYDLVLLLGRAEVFRYDNVYRARSLGVEAALSWVDPSEHVELGLNSTYQDFRNRSDGGGFETFRGDRIPNKPYFFINGRAQLRARAVAAARDELALTWYARYVHEFFRTWESVGPEEGKPTVPTQLLHTAVLSYLTRGPGDRELSFSAEAQNLANAKTFDFYGVQRPGRVVNFKASIVY
jgi:vitamin B12 transporter